jgi:hypothetical protein
MFAAVAGFGLAAAAASLFQRRAHLEDADYNGGYNALATVVDQDS